LVREELSARLKALFRRFEATLDVDGARKEVRSLVDEFGIDAIEAALDEAGEDRDSITVLIPNPANEIPCGFLLCWHRIGQRTQRQVVNPIALFFDRRDFRHRLATARDAYGLSGRGPLDQLTQICLCSGDVDVSHWS
jgi:hypothetical protein